MLLSILKGELFLNIHGLIGGSGCYKPYSEKNGRDLHTELLKRIKDYINKNNNNNKMSELKSYSDFKNSVNEVKKDIDPLMLALKATVRSGIIELFKLLVDRSNNPKAQEIFNEAKSYRDLYLREELYKFIIKENSIPYVANLPQFAHYAFDSLRSFKVNEAQMSSDKLKQLYYSLEDEGKSELEILNILNKKFGMVKSDIEKLLKTKELVTEGVDSNLVDGSIIPQEELKDLADKLADFARTYNKDLILDLLIKSKYDKNFNIVSDVSELTKALNFTSDVGTLNYVTVGLRHVKLDNLDEAKKEIYVMDPMLVKPGMKGLDYADASGKVIQIVRAKEAKLISKYGDIDFVNDEDMEIDLETDYVVAVRLEDGDTTVYGYGGNGFCVSTTDKSKEWKLDKAKKEIFEMDPMLVKPGMTGIDYADASGQVIKIVRAKYAEVLSEYGDIDFVADEEINLETDYVVAVRLEDGDTTVYVYGGNGFCVSTTDKSKEWKLDNLDEAKKEIYVMDPMLVKPGMKGIDYADAYGNVIQIVPAKEAKLLSKYGDIDFVTDEDMGLNLKRDYVVAVRLEDGDTTVYGYGGDGFYVETSDKSKQWKIGSNIFEGENLKADNVVEYEGKKYLIHSNDNSTNTVYLKLTNGQMAKDHIGNALQVHKSRVKLISSKVNEAEYMLSKDIAKKLKIGDTIVNVNGEEIKNPYVALDCGYATFASNGKLTITLNDDLSDVEKVEIYDKASILALRDFLNKIV